MSHGVRIFRVDNPHTKPVDFWAWLLAEVRRTDPDVLFFAEAFTRPAMMHVLGKVGFHMSYTYFTWRNEKWEIEEYVTELATETDSFFRPNFFVNTPDINPFYLQTGGKSAFTIRAVLAATLSPLWGVYSGFELFESAAARARARGVPGLREVPVPPARLAGRRRERGEPQPAHRPAQPGPPRAPGPAAAARRALPHREQRAGRGVLQARRGRPTAGGDDDIVLVVSSVDPHDVVESDVVLDMEALGLSSRDVFLVHDELTGQTWRWGQRAFVRLTHDDPCHVLTVVRHGRASA